jgi:hypothetical protein
VLEHAGSLWDEVSELVCDQLALAALETRRAGESLVTMVVTGVGANALVALMLYVVVRRKSRHLQWAASIDPQHGFRIGCEVEFGESRCEPIANRRQSRSRRTSEPVLLTACGLGYLLGEITSRQPSGATSRKRKLVSGVLTLFACARLIPHQVD